MSYKVELTHGEDIFKAKAKSIEDALAELDFDRLNIKLKGILKVKKGKKEAEMPLTAFRIKRIKSNKMMREILAGKLKNLL